ncbi:PIG-L family deacetylase [Flammeovirga sp. SubArs3]|uniref:PIG-L family deacetylase n=1 Tax=Flammeovirga sp. SubArs3 TaxID=2995316 RepID=UPI00248CEE58|nr:PIG-L family deacetylase [Flammeovirga sp. SubArs3]
MKSLLLSFFIFLQLLSLGQTPKDHQENVSSIIQDINHLDQLGSVMYFAAHPDDENQRVIAYFARSRGYETAYTALTRGDGGQNLIGTEIREELGMLRSQELIEARKVDGGNQLFSRANDFGYSKNPEETLSVWDKDQVLADAVWNIRKFRPDIIITRFSPNRGGRTHGHHTTSAIIAAEAFKIAGDSTVYPEQLKYVDPWQPKRIMWNTNSWFFRGKGESFDASKFVSLETGTYIPVLGKSVGEIAMAARSKHRCQGFGAALQRGENLEYFELLDGTSMSEDPMEDIDTSWARVENSSKVAELIKKLQSTFNASKAADAIPQLIAIKKELSKLNQKDYWVIKKSNIIDDLILRCSGLFLEVLSDDALIAQGDSLKVTLNSIYRAGQNISLANIQVGNLVEKEMSTKLEINKINKQSLTVKVPNDFPISQPYWLVEKPTKGMYIVNDQKLRGTPENSPSLPVIVSLNINGVNISKTLNIWQKKVNPARGEVYIPLAIVPPVSIEIDQSVMIFSDNTSKKVNAVITSNTKNIKGTLSFTTPKGWNVQPASSDFNLQNKGDKLEVLVSITPSKKDSEGTFKAIANIDNNTYDLGLNTIDYEHIFRQYIFKPAEAKVIKLDIQRGDVDVVGYLMGAGDVVPQSLEAAGYTVEIINPENVKLEEIKKFDAIVIGIRAYNVLENMRYIQPVLMDYVQQGGNVIVQYNTSFRLKVDQVGPYEGFKLSRDRITVEESPVEILAKGNPIMSYPNKITKKDFDGWVQERGLYYPNEWGTQYTPILRMKDPNQDPVDGALLVADYGQGAFIYSGISWFRELPAGVSGAFRIFANMLNYKPENKQ